MAATLVYRLARARPWREGENGMIDRLVDAAISGAALGAGSAWAAKKMSEQTTGRPIWQTEIDGQILTIIEHQVHGHLSYEAFIVAAGVVSPLGRFANYPAVLAITQQWVDYLHAGGTVKAWRAQAPVKATTQRVPTRTAIATKRARQDAFLALLPQGLGLRVGYWHRFAGPAGCLLSR